MALIKADESQFKTEGTRVTHIPTGARFSTYPGSDSTDATINWGQAGSVLANGDEYDRDDIATVARRILFPRK